MLFEGENGRIFINRDRLTGKPIEDMTKADREWLKRRRTKALRRPPPARGRRRGLAAALPRPELHLPQPHAELFRLRQIEELPASDIFSHHRVMNACHMCTIAIKLKRKPPRCAQGRICGRR